LIQGEKKRKRGGGKNTLNCQSLFWFKRIYSQGISSNRKNHKCPILFRNDGIIVAGHARFSWKQELVFVAQLCTCIHHICYSMISFSEIKPTCPVQQI
jgi:hypothetical protein